MNSLVTEKQLMKVAKKEIAAWHDLPPGLVLAILFAFVHRVTTGRTIEESFFRPHNKWTDFEI